MRILSVATLFVVALVCLLSAAPTLADRFPRTQGPDYLKWTREQSTGYAGGVYGKCREYWLWNAQERQQRVQNTPCPFGPYAANIVNHFIRDPNNHHEDGNDCGALVEYNVGDRGAGKDPTLHAEMESIHRLMDCNLHPENCHDLGNGTLVQTQSLNRTFWQQLSMYSTGESCAMDAAAEAIAGFGEVIYGFPSDEHMRRGWPGLDIDSKDVYRQAYWGTMIKLVISDVQIDRYRPLYVWQYDRDAYCPNGCKRTDDGSSCVKAW